MYKLEIINLFFKLCVITSNFNLNTMIHYCQRTNVVLWVIFLATLIATKVVSNKRHFLSNYAVQN